MATTEANVPVSGSPDKATATEERREPSRHPLVALRDEVDRLFDDFFTGFAAQPFRRKALDADPWRRFQGMFEGTFPIADVVEADQDYRITAELPGMGEKDIEIALAGDVLTLKGEKKEEHEEKAANRFVAERRYGAFQRSFTLPEDADAERITAAFKNGVLTVSLPKRPDAKPRQRRIEVKAN